MAILAINRHSFHFYQIRHFLQNHHFQKENLLNQYVWIRKMKCNTFFISSVCYHLFTLFLYFKFLSYHYFNGFCFQTHTFKVIHWLCTVHLLLRITRWPRSKRASEVTLFKWSWLKRNSIGNFACGIFLPRWDSMCWECAQGKHCMHVAEFDFLNLYLLTLIFI